MIWCKVYCMYLKKPSESTCARCDELDECCELNRRIDEAVKNGLALSSPRL